MADAYVSLAEVLAFVERTIEKGVPERVAITRAARHYNVPRDWVVAGQRYDRELKRDQPLGHRSGSASTDSRRSRDDGLK